MSLGYLSEVERGQKEASSELLASICGALGAPMSQLLREVSDNFALAELKNEPVFTGVRVLTPDVARVPEPGAPAEELELVTGDGKVTVKGGTRFAYRLTSPSSSRSHGTSTTFRTWSRR